LTKSKHLLYFNKLFQIGTEELEMIRKYKITQALIALFLLPLAANATTPIEFDADGQDGPNGSDTAGAVDWLFGSTLFTSADSDAAIPMEPGTTKTIQVYAHGALEGIAAPDGTGRHPH
jgi:hypothetical protein